MPPDSLRAVLDSVFTSPAYDWRPPNTAVTWIQQRWRAVVEWLTTMRDLNPRVYHAVVLLLVATLVAIILHAAWILYRTARRAEEGVAGMPDAALPAARDAAWFRAEADRLAGEGRLADAMQAAFVALALHLDAIGLLQYQASRTPAECAREARLAGADQVRLQRLVGELYRAAFGGAPVAAADYRAWHAEVEGVWHAPAH